MSQTSVKWSQAFPPGNQTGLPRLEIFANFLVGSSDQFRPLPRNRRRVFHWGY